MKKTTMVLISIILITILLAGCGGGSGSSAPASSAPPAPSPSSTAPAASSTSPAPEPSSSSEPESSATQDYGTLEDAIAKYGLDAAPRTDTGPFQDMSDTRLPAEDLQMAYETLTLPENEGISYDEILTIVGAEPSQFRMGYANPQLHWYSAEDETDYIMVFLEDESLGYILRSHGTNIL